MEAWGSGKPGSKSIPVREGPGGEVIDLVSSGSKEFLALVRKSSYRLAFYRLNVSGTEHEWTQIAKLPKDVSVVAGVGLHTLTSDDGLVSHVSMAKKSARMDVCSHHSCEL